MILLDTGIVYATYDRGDAWHERAAALVRKEKGALLLPAPAIPEIDFLLGKRLGREARETFYEAILENHFFVMDLPRDRYARVSEINRMFADLDLGFVDAAIVAIGEHLDFLRIATTDRRHFEPMAAKLKLELVP